MRRHNAVTKVVAQRLRNHGYLVIEEPRLKTKEGLRKPDILASKDDRVLIVDAQVVNEQFDLRTAHRNKVRYYQQNVEVAALAFQKVGLQRGDVAFTSCTLNWKGISCRRGCS